jgi:hypothetical protein
VYEEKQRDPAWGMPMDATFREMVLDEETLTPVSQLSGAFMNAKTQEHVMFAYYESSQVVEYLLEKYGKEKLQGILRDLAAGKRINDAIAANAADLDEIEEGFTKFIKAKANGFGAKADWKEPKPEELNPFDDGSFATYLKKHPNNLPATRKYAQEMVNQKNWPEVIKTADILIQLLPEDFSAESGRASR